MRQVRRLGAVLTAAGLVAVAGCGTDGSPAPDAAEATPADAPWNPCDGLDADPIGDALGTPVQVDDGVGEVYKCSVVPAAEGAAAFTVTYQWGGGSLAEVWDQMWEVAPELEQVQVPGADATRLVVDAGPDAVLVTGFVQTGDLIQVVNTTDLAPYHRGPVVAATEVVLTQLAAAAPERPRS